ncbi:sigma 54-interacting transcriptional regulator [Oleidesulfovibrio sp.]|uniref:sigma 54-interacting transcriptional regulator n=1 Tax=Oleidesulfovibrio sp. TaxID=2909707 RepID=UPI003A8B5A04
MARILVVDDEESICFTFRVFLSGAGHTVETASSYAEAMHSISQHTPDLIFADIMLGGPSGIDLLRSVRARDLDAPFILITGEPSMDTAVEAVALGAFQYLFKPVDKEALLQAATIALRHKCLMDEKERLQEEKEALGSHLKAVFNAVPDAIVTVSYDYTVLSANEASRAILGIDPEKVQGKPCVDALGTAAGVCMPMLIEALRHQHSVQRSGEPLVLDSGEVIVDLTAVPLGAPSAQSTEPAPESVPDEFDPQLQQAASQAARAGSEGISGVQDAAPSAGVGVMLMARDVTRLVGLERALEAQRSQLGMIGRSSEMRNVFRLVESLADTDTTVLVTGESGTGKELIADALHHTGARGKGPFVKVNCSALSENLLESELFGHVRGAFTGATRDRIGRIQMAHGGTLFLDEIGDISPSVQLKLLRVLQEKEIERVGDVQPIKVDVRVVAATNKSLRDLVAQGLFREDLYYRLKVVEIHLPPLRNRREDIPLLADCFVKEFNNHFQRRVSGIESKAQRLLIQYNWPGNIRELRHAVEHAFIMTNGSIVPASALPPEILYAGQTATYKPVEGVKNGFVSEPPATYNYSAAYQTDDVWEERLAAAMKEAGGNKAKAARILGVSRQTVYRKLRELGLEG